MIDDRSYHSEITFEMNGKNSSEEASGFYETIMPQNNSTNTYTYSDGLCLHIQEPCRLYSYHYTCHEVAQQHYVSELFMYPTYLARRYISAIHCYPSHNNNDSEKPWFQQSVFMVPKNRQCVLSSRVFKENKKMERHKRGIKFQPKQHTVVYSSTIFLEPNY